MKNPGNVPDVSALIRRDRESARSTRAHGGGLRDVIDSARLSAFISRLLTRSVISSNLGEIH